MIVVDTEVNCVNKFTLDRWKFTFEIPRLLVIEHSMRCFLTAVRWNRLDHPFGYRKFALYGKIRETNPSSAQYSSNTII